MTSSPPAPRQQAGVSTLMHVGADGMPTGIDWRSPKTWAVIGGVAAALWWLRRR